MLEKRPSNPRGPTNVNINYPTKSGTSQAAVAVNRSPPAHVQASAGVSAGAGAGVGRTVCLRPSYGDAVADGPGADRADWSTWYRLFSGKSSRRTRRQPLPSLVNAVPDTDGEWVLPLPLDTLLFWAWQRWEIEVCAAARS